VVSGKFSRAGQPEATVDGFCDSADGRVFRIRFMPSAAGDYSYSVNYHQGEFRKDHSGSCRAVNGNRRGVLRVDPDYPFHFIWEGTGEHYFFNGTTAFFMMGWRDDAVINRIIDQLEPAKESSHSPHAGRPHRASSGANPSFPARIFRFASTRG
jgi:hypothetical protein